MATHSSILAWRIPMDRGAWQLLSMLYSIVQGRKELDTTKRLTFHFSDVDRHTYTQYVGRKIFKITWQFIHSKNQILAF